MQYICNAISSMRSADGIVKKTATRRAGNALGGHEIFSPFAAQRMDSHAGRKAGRGNIPEKAPVRLKKM
jgi:hypothetical protein